MQLAKPAPIVFCVVAMLAISNTLPFDKARAQDATVCVKNDEHCLRIEAQVNALFDLAEEVLKTKAIPPVEQIETRLGVKAERYRQSNGYEFRPTNSPDLVFYGSYNTTALSNGMIRVTFGFSINKHHACVQMNNLKSRLPGGKDEVRSHGFKGERIQPIAKVQFMVAGNPEVYLTFDYWYQRCLGGIHFSTSDRVKE